jgi:c-di-GMP-binding flagellar brake protein YcgR
LENSVKAKKGILYFLMATGNPSDRRQYPRYPLESELIGCELSLLGVTEENKHIRGHVEDISEGGICLLTSKPLGLTNPIQCKIRLAKLPVAVPVIMRVQWSLQVSTASSYRNGLQFLY